MSAALGAGVLTFLSPCVLPLIPGYLAFITGMGTAELTAKGRNTAAILVPYLLFVAGFTVVFVALGASASILGSFLAANRKALEMLAGAVITLLGFFMLGVVKVPWLYGEARFEPTRARALGVAAAFITGVDLPVDGGFSALGPDQGHPPAHWWSG